MYLCCFHRLGIFVFKKLLRYENLYVFYFKETKEVTGQELMHLTWFLTAIIVLAAFQMHLCDYEETTFSSKDF